MLFAEDGSTIQSVRASACTLVLLRTGVGKVKHHSTKELLVGGVLTSYGMDMKTVSLAKKSLGHSGACSGSGRVEKASIGLDTTLLRCARSILVAWNMRGDRLGS